MRLRSLPHGCPHRRRLAKLCQKLGGRLIRVSEDTFQQIDALTKRAWHEAPFTHHMLALSWHHKTIAYSGDVSWTEIIHEMGHVFACSKSPRYYPEEWPFFGWEIAVAKMFDLKHWIDTNDYIVGSDAEDICPSETMKDLTPKQLDTMIQERVAVAKRTGLLDKHDRPRSIR